MLIGFMVSLAVIGIFASITEGLVDSSPLTRFDVVVAERLRESAAPAALRTFEFVSRLGGRGAMTLLLFGGGFVYALRRKGLELAGWCAAFIGGSLLDAALRFVVRRSELPFADIVLLDWGTGSGERPSARCARRIWHARVFRVLVHSQRGGSNVDRRAGDGAHLGDRDFATLSRPTLSQRRERRRGGRTAVAHDVYFRNRDRAPAALAAVARHRPSVSS